MITPIELTANQINSLDSIHLDIITTKEVIKVALNYSNNRLAELEKSRSQFWEELARIHHLDLVKKQYKTQKINNMVCVIEEDELNND